ncbi:MAG: lipase family alpha/beta hydrolase [Nanobdellota archaeon]
MSRINVSKKFWKRLAIIGSSVVVLFMALYLLFGVKMYFVFNEEMDLDLTPLEQSFSVVNGEKIPLNISFSANTPLVCSAQCTYEFKDLSLNETLDNGSITDPESIVKDYALVAPFTGAGQKMYRFMLSCRSKQTDVCRSSERTYTKSSLITLNYDLSDSLKQEQQSLNSSLSSLLANTSHSAYKEHVANHFLSELNKQVTADIVEEQTLSQQLSSLKTTFSSFSSTVDELITLWEGGNFTAISSSSLDVASLTKKAVVNSSNEVYVDALQLQEMWNESIVIIDSLSFLETNFSQAMNYVHSVNNTSAFSEGLSLKNDSRSLSLQPLQSSNMSLEHYHDRLVDIEHNISSFIQFAKQSEQSFLEHFNQSLDTAQSFLSFLGFSSVFQNTVLSSESVCDDFNAVSTSIESQQSSALQFRQQNYSFLDGVSETEEVCSIVVDSFYDSFSDSTSLSSQSIVPEEYENVSIQGYGSFNYSSIPVSDYKKLCPVSQEALFDDSQISYCSSSYNDSSELVSSFSQSEFTPISKPSFSEVTPSSFYSFPSSIPSFTEQCCVFGNCSPCCGESSASCSENYPVVFVHGHALSESKSPESSLIAFSQMQTFLEDEKYVNAGEITDDTLLYSIPEGDWGRVDAPFSVRVSYYYLTHYGVGGAVVLTQKDDKIENYAIRLKELVDLILYRSQSDKVILVSHSMGGLVSREYLRLFGSDNVDKLITIGTPNHGIEGSVRKYCAVTGAKRECEDMEKGSVFLNRLNSAQENGIPGIDTYTIRAVGCEMDDGRQGDGVIIADSVPLDFAVNYRIEGNCSDSLLEDTMHTRLVRPKEYPQVYDIVTAIISDSPSSVQEFVS